MTSRGHEQEYSDFEQSVDIEEFDEILSLLIFSTIPDPRRQVNSPY